MTSYPRVEVKIRSRSGGLKKAMEASDGETNGRGLAEVPPETASETKKGQVLAFHTIPYKDRVVDTKTFAVIQTDDDELIQEKITNLTVIDKPKTSNI